MQDVNASKRTMEWEIHRKTTFPEFESMHLYLEAQDLYLHSPGLLEHLMCSRVFMVESYKDLT